MKRYIFTFAAPFLLVLVACIQIYHAKVHDLSPWKGGGFGMFSTSDAPAHRTLRAYLLTERGDALVIEPKFKVSINRLSTMPNDKELKGAAMQIAAAEWSVYNYDNYQDIISDLPMALQMHFLNRGGLALGDGHSSDSTALSADSASAALGSSDVVAPYPQLIALPRSDSVSVPEQPYYGVRIEVWRMHFDPQRSEMFSEKLNEVTVNLNQEGAE